MADHILETRKALVTAMRGDVPLGALVPAMRVYGEQVPANPPWPFILCGLPTETPLFASCWDASTLGVVVHGFARGPAMDGASGIGNAIKRALGGATLVRDGLTITLQHAQTQIIRDTAESSDYHVIVRFDADVVEAA